MSETPFGQLPSSARTDLKTLEGRVMAIFIGGCHEDLPTRHDPKPGIRMNLVDVTDPDRPVEHIDLLLFNAPIVRQFRSVDPGTATVGRVKVDRSFAFPAVSFEPASEDEMARAAKWNANNPGRAAQLSSLAVTTYRHEEANRRDRSQRPMSTSVQHQPTQQSYPTGPNYAGSNPPPSAPPSPPPQPRPATDEPPF